MPKPMFAAAGEAVPQITKEDVRKSYEILALLTVCSHALVCLDVVGEAHISRITGSVADVLDIAAAIALEVHTAVERAGP